MTSFADTLRDIARRLDEAVAMRNEALDELAHVAGDGLLILDFLSVPSEPDGDPASVLEAAGDQAGAPAGAATAGSSGSPAPPIDEPGQVPTAAAGGGKPVPAFDPLGAELRACLEPGCGRSFTSPHGLQVHRTRAHGRNWSTKPELTEPEKPSKRATAGARLADRDAARAHPRPARSPAPAAGVTRPASIGAAPVIRKGTESWVCNRCPESFRTREARDLHQEADHDSEPRRLPVGEPQPVFDTSLGGFRD